MLMDAYRPVPFGHTEQLVGCELSELPFVGSIDYGHRPYRCASTRYRHNFVYCPKDMGTSGLRCIFVPRIIAFITETSGADNQPQGSPAPMFTYATATHGIIRST